MYSFIPKNKFEKLVHLVGFIIRIYHNARSSECPSVWQVQMFLTAVLSQHLLTGVCYNEI